MFKRILVCLDGTKSNEGILPYVVEQAKKFNSKVFLLRVNAVLSNLPDYSANPGTLPAGTLASIAINAEEDFSNSYLKGIAARLSEAGLDVEAIVMTGTITELILKCIKEKSIDLVAMASHVYKGWKRFISGSTMEDVLRKCDIPVLAINSRVTDEQTETLALRNGRDFIGSDEKITA
jgi:nucleotide-binding universal stress UspA family protein